MNGLDIKDLRLKLGVTQRELAEMVGVSEKTVQNWEYGKICSSVDNVEVVKFVYLFMYRFCIFNIPFFCVPKNPCCGFDSFFLSLFPNDC